MAKPKAEHIRPDCIGCGACVAIAPDFWQMDDNDNKADLKKCKKTMKGSEIVKEESYMFKLSKFQDRLLSLIKSGKYSILPERKRKEIISFIESGLKDISISRLKEKVYWGIELPFDKKHVVFVWIDAFWNYFT